MRIIAGKYKGRVLNPIKNPNIRPTSDKVRGAIFNMLQFELEDKTVCDLFSGTGAIGIEALSRGAKFCTFVESNNRISMDIKKNLEKLDVSRELYEIINKSAESFLADNKIKYDLIFMDPPYDHNLINLSIDKIYKSGSVCLSGKIVIEHRASEEIDLNYIKEFEMLKQKSYGDTLITFLGCAYSENPEV